MGQTSSDPTIAMRGGGYYSDSTVGAKTVIDATTPLVDVALGALVSKTYNKPFAIADFGASDGGTSLDLMRHIVRTVRARSPHRTITLTYTDLPYNDFSSLFRRLHGILDVEGVAPLAQEPGLSHLRAQQAFTARSFQTKHCRSVFRLPLCTG